MLESPLWPGSTSTRHSTLRRDGVGSGKGRVREGGAGQCGVMTNEGRKEGVLSIYISVIVVPE